MLSEAYSCHTYPAQVSSFYHPFVAKLNQCLLAPTGALSIVMMRRNTIFPVFTAQPIEILTYPFAKAPQKFLRITYHIFMNEVV